MIEISKLDELKNLSGKTIIDLQKFEISDAELEQYLNFCGDENPIHETGDQGGAVIPGNMLITLLPQFIQSELSFSPHMKCMTTGYQKIEFREALKVMEELEVSVACASVRIIKGRAFVDYDFEFSKSGSEKTAVKGIMSDCYL